MSVQVAATELSTCRVPSWRYHARGQTDSQGSGGWRAGSRGTIQNLGQSLPLSSHTGLLLPWDPRITRADAQSHAG